LTPSAGCARILAVSGDEASALARLLTGGMIGAAVGALVGLVVFGGLLFVPLLCTIVGAWVGGSIADRPERRGRTVERPGLRVALGEPLPRRAPRARSAQPAGGAGGGAGAVRAGPARLPTPRGDLPPIDVNTADVEGLTGLPGVGRGAAARIVAFREEQGPFRSLADLELVEGFDMARVARLATRATLSDLGATGEGGPPAESKSQPGGEAEEALPA
jgi:competence protein ComEA